MGAGCCAGAGAWRCPGSSPQRALLRACGCRGLIWLAASVGKLRQEGTLGQLPHQWDPALYGQAMAPLGVCWASPQPRTLACLLPAQRAACSLPPAAAVHFSTLSPSAHLSLRQPPAAPPAPKGPERVEVGGKSRLCRVPLAGQLQLPAAPRLSGQSTWALSSPAYAQPVLLVSAQFPIRCSGNAKEGGRWRSPPSLLLHLRLGAAWGV